RTGIGLPETLGLIRNAGLFASNDTGLYHAAAAPDVPAVALFTFTDTDKNYDPVFHRRTRIITTGMECQPCQLTSPGHWLKLQPSVRMGMSGHSAKSRVRCHQGVDNMSVRLLV